MRNCIAVLFAVLLCSVIYAEDVAPFGISPGMSKSELKIVGESEDFVVRVVLPKPHPKFEDSGIVTLNENNQVVQLIVLTKPVRISPNGNEIVTELVNLASTLGRKFGSPVARDFLRAGSPWDREQDYAMALHQTDRILMAYWVRGSGKATLPDTLEQVMIQAVSESVRSVYLRLSYSFNGYGDLQKRNSEKSEVGLSEVLF